MDNLIKRYRDVLPLATTYIANRNRLVAIRQEKNSLLNPSAIFQNEADIVAYEKEKERFAEAYARLDSEEKELTAWQASEEKYEDGTLHKLLVGDYYDDTQPDITLNIGGNLIYSDEGRIYVSETNAEKGEQSNINPKHQDFSDGHTLLRNARELVFREFQDVTDDRILATAQILVTARLAQYLHDFNSAYAGVHY